MPKAAKASSTPRRTASKIPTKKRAKAKRAAPRADAGLFAAIERYYDAVREYDIRLKIFSKVEFIEPRPRGWVSKERAYATLAVSKIINTSTHKEVEVTLLFCNK
jgi:hypothetical protein